MNPYHAVAVAQHNQSLLLVARSARAQSTRTGDSDARRGVIGRIRGAATGAWSLATSTRSSLPVLRDYPTANTI